MVDLVAIQNKLAEIGLLDPPADAHFGPLTRWAVEQVTGDSLDGDTGITDAQAAKVMAAAPLPLTPKNDTAGKIIQAWQKRGAWIARHSKMLNIGYVEAMNTDGTYNNDTPNHFDASRCLIRIVLGVPVLAGIWDATTEASRYWTENPMNEGGAARIILGQQRCWSWEKYHGDALIQVRDTQITRDPDATYKRYGPIFTGSFGIHHHRGYNYPKNDEGRSSAGCQVGRTNDGHAAFMALLATDQRYRLNNGFVWSSTVIRSSELQTVAMPYMASAPMDWITHVKATSFGAPDDDTQSFYGGRKYHPSPVVDYKRPGYALPFKFDPPPLIEVRISEHPNSPVVLAKGEDLGPWYDGRHSWPLDPYWQTPGQRPRAESDDRTNGAGIDLTPGAWKALGFPQDFDGTFVDWRFHSAD